MTETETTLRLEFARGSDAPRSITVASDGDDDQHLQLFGSVCRFIWVQWPNDDRRTVLAVRYDGLMALC